MPTNTYVALDKKTVTSAVASVEFTSISSAYTDLVVIANIIGTADSSNVLLRFNSDSSSLYSHTWMNGSGTAATSGRDSGQTSIMLTPGTVGSGSSTSPVVYTGSIQNYSNTTSFKSVLNRYGTSNASFNGVLAQVGLYRSTNAISAVSLTAQSTTFAVGSTFSLYGIAATATGTGTAKATGGTITYDSFGYVMHTFTSSGTFTPSANLTCDYLVVAGGGAGGSVGGGGGAGGFRTSYGISGRNSGPEPQLSVTASTAYSIQVGGGGSAVNQDKGNSGTNSIFSTVTSTGGGGGGSNQSGKFAGRDGGSGGGARGSGPAGLGTAGQGFDGALSTYGGGGGAGATGISPGTDPAGAAGGAGLPSTILGSTVYYAGGGGSISSSTSAAGGVGGGGAGGVYPYGGTAGSSNTGGGGGAGGDGGQLAGAGGSGIVIIKYYGL
jgi:hypothetical protein